MNIMEYPNINYIKMKYRKDITEYLKKRMKYFKKDYKIYEQDEFTAYNG